MTTYLSPAEVLPFLHGCCGTYALQGYTGFSRFTEEELAYYGARSDMDFLRSRTPAGIWLDCITDAPEISFTYRLYREKGMYFFGSSFEIRENDLPGVVFRIDPQNTEAVTVSYPRRCQEPSRIRIYCTGGSVAVFEKFCLGNAVPVGKYPRSILFYGDSITQSAYIPPPSLSWTNLVSCRLGAEFVNRGIGSMIFEADSLPSAPDCTPDLLCIEYGCNDISQTPDNATAIQNACAWLEKICVLYPTVPKYCILPDFIPRVAVSEAYWNRLAPYWQELEAICTAMHISAVSGRSLIPESSSMYLADHIHFSEAGSSLFAENLYPVLRQPPAFSL